MLDGAGRLVSTCIRTGGCNPVQYESKPESGLVINGGIMRNLIIVFISLFTFCIGISGQQKCKLNVGSFNLRYDNEGDKDDSMAHRKDMAVSLVHFHDF